MENEKKMKTHKIGVNTLMTLCHILDDYSLFSNNLTKLISVKYNRDIVQDLIKISTGKGPFVSRKVKHFYQENKSVIDTINNYSFIGNFIIENYDSTGKLVEDSSLNFFYNYLLNHKNEVKKIISILEKLDEIGIYKLEFDENADFTNAQYFLNTWFGLNIDVIYLDNMEAIPNYDCDLVKYRTTESNYEIILKPNNLGEFFECNRTIILNDLIFDVNRLPKEITKESIFDKIIGLKEAQKDVCNDVINSVDLNIAIIHLFSQFKTTSQIIEGLNDTKNKEELLELLTEIKNNLNRLQSLSCEYDNNVSQMHPSVTKEQLENEKQLCLRNRYLSSIDID